MIARFSAERLIDSEPHGRAALLLVESLIHTLIDRKIITIADALEVVEVATDVQREAGAELGELPLALQKSIDALQAISASLAIDIPSEN